MRPNKQTVDYFPHYAKPGKTIFILQNKFGNDGYAFWFKLLELFSVNNNHFIDCRNLDQWEYLLAYTGVNEDIAINIINTLLNLGKIDPVFWENKVLFSENFFENIKIVYERRKNECMNKQDLCKHLHIKCNHKPDSNELLYHRNTQRKGKEIKGKEITEITLPFSEKFKTQWEQWVVFRKEIKKPLTPSATKQQILDIQKWAAGDEDLACEILQASIRGGYQGLFEPKFPKMELRKQDRTYQTGENLSLK